jgi:dGTPase
MIGVGEIEEIERKSLKPYACFSKGAKRNKGINQHPLRTEFQRDRDRILHSKAFRRLEYKTQVFLTQRGDHARTRLTHSLEVEQLSRTVAYQLGLNCDLVEAISLGHDLGHTPFGHAGERELRRLLGENGIKTFKHNVQSVKIVELLEKKYEYNGLALTLPVKEGILKHTGLPDEIPVYCKDLFVDKTFSVTLEGQVVAIVDEIAQITHDIDDYFRYDIISYEEFEKSKIFELMSNFYELRKVNIRSILNEQGESRKDTVIRCLIDFLMTTLIEHSSCNLNGKNSIRAYDIDKIYVKFNDEFEKEVNSFHDKITDIIKKNYKIKEMDNRGANTINKLFEYFRLNLDKLPEETRLKIKNNSDDNPLNIVADYISGMTDRYATEQYEFLYGINIR